MSDITKVHSSKKSSLTYLLKELVGDLKESYDQESIEEYTYLDNLLESYTDDLALRFQRMLVNRRALTESEYVMVVNDGIKNKAVFDLDIIHLDTQFDGHTPYHEVLHHTKTYGDNDGMSFQEILRRKLRRKLNHISKFIQNKTRVDGVLKLGTQLFNVSTEVLFQDNVRVGLIQAVLTVSE